MFFGQEVESWIWFLVGMGVRAIQQRRMRVLVQAAGNANRKPSKQGCRSAIRLERREMCY